MKSQVLLALAIAGAPAAAWGQPGPVIDAQRADRRPPQAPAAPAQAAPAGPIDVEASSEPLVALRRVAVEGSSLAPARWERTFAPFVGRPLGRETIQAIAAAAAKAYAGGDLALYTITVPRQDLSGGLLRLQALEGHVGQVALQGQVKGRDLKLVSAQAAKLTSEIPLRRVTLERQLSLIRDIPGLTVDANLLPGKSLGAVVLVLDLKHKAPDLTFSVNNRGSSLLGRTQMQADLNLYSTFRQGDQTKLTLGLPTDPERFQYYAVTHSQPLAANGLRGQINAGYFRTRPDNPPSKGKATFGGMQLSYPVIRSYQQNLVLTGALDGLDSENAVFGQGTATEKIRVLRGAAAWSLSKPKRQAWLSATASQGIDGLGAHTSAGVADADFTKLNIRAGYDQALGERWAVRLKAIAQASSDLLPSSEQFSVGGSEFGRAFEQAVVIGDTGAAASIELAWRPSGLPKALAGSEIYSFADAARVTQAARFGRADFDYRLASAGMGGRLAIGKKSALALEGAYGLDDPRPGRDGAWRFGVNVAVRR